MSYNVLIAVNHTTKKFAVTCRRDDQYSKMSFFRRKFDEKGYDVSVYANDLESSLANSVRDAHKFMYSKSGYDQVVAS